MKRIFLILLVSLCFLSGCSLLNEEEDKNENVVVENDDDILKLTVTPSYVLFQDKNNDLYLYGNYSNVNLKSLNAPKKIYDNIKYYKNSGRLVIIDNKDNAYYIGLDKDGMGTKDSFELLTSDVKKIASNNFCFYVIDKDNDLRFKIPSANKDAMSYCALTGNYIGDMSKEIYGVKDLYTSLTMFGYVHNNGDFYVSYTQNPNFEKVLSNVDYIVGEQILTKDYKLYYLNTSVIDRVPDTKLINDSVVKIYENNFYKTINKEFYYQNKKLEYSDIRYPYYYDSENFIYLNTKGKLVLVNSKDKKEIDLNVDAMKEILDFINNKTLN